MREQQIIIAIVNNLNKIVKVEDRATQCQQMLKIDSHLRRLIITLEMLTTMVVDATILVITMTMVSIITRHGSSDKK